MRLGSRRREPRPDGEPTMEPSRVTPEQALAPAEELPAPPPRTRLRELLRAAVHGFETWSVVVILALMTLLPTLESLARWFLRRGIPGSVLYVQHLTLWVGFLAALLATRAGKHLALATGGILPPGRFRDAAHVYVNALSAAVCALLAWASVELVRADSAMERVLPGGVPEWWSELVMPAALGMMALRFAWRASDRWAPRAVALALAAGMVLTAALVRDPAVLLAPAVAMLLLGLVLGAPVFIAMAGVAMALFAAGGTPIAAVPAETFRLVASSSLPAIPLLTAAGYILAEGGASRRLLRLARALIGWAPGGLAVIIVVVLAGFTAFTGGSGVTILALGGLVLPMLVSEKYPEGFSLGLVSSAGSLGLLFPPSLPVILYAVVAGASVEELYVAGFVPGMLFLVLVSVVGAVVGVRQRAPRQPFAPREAAAALWAAKWELAIPAVVLLAIFTGFATMVEAAAIAVLLAIVSQSFIFRDLHWRRQLPDVLASGAVLVGAVLILLGVAMGLTSWLVDAEIPSAVLEWTKAHIHSPVAFLLALNGVLLVLGSVLEIYSAIIILAPLLTPMAAAYGIDPLHLGVVFLANLGLGFLFPPMGLNLILASTRFGQPLARLYRVSAPFLVIMAAGVLLATYLPAMTTGVLAWYRN